MSGWQAATCVVVKIGSSLIVDAGGVRHGWMQSVAADVAALRAQGVRVVLVSSGAVALAREAFGKRDAVLRLEEKQALAACGQMTLMQHWQAAFGTQPVAQVLLTAEDSEHRRRYLNARATLHTLLEMGVVPIINENDTVATLELRVGDNDRLAARVAQMIEADTLVLLSDIDGLYTADPRTDAAAQHLAEVPAITPEIEAMAGGARTLNSNGGMVTKLQAAQVAVGSGCRMAITLGAPNHPLQRLQEGARATWFAATDTPASARKRWIAGTLHPAGTLVVDAGAAQALAEGKSLLPAGVVRVEGSFERGDAVLIAATDGTLLAKGLVAYDHDESARIAGKHTREIADLVGFQGRSALVHRDDMVRMVADKRGKIS